MILSSLPRKVTAVLLTAILLVTVLSPTVSALTPYSYSMSADYKASVYYQNLVSLTLTGNGASDVLMVAMSQLGYHEGNSTSDFAGTSTSGSRNFVEYNRLAGKLDNNEGNGMSYGYAWCASFVNWCLRQAKIPKTVAGGEVSCSRWIRDFLKPSGIWEASPSAGGNYTPRAGDLIFFRKSGSASLSTHVGLVLYADATYVYTVEGNTSAGCVARAKYALDSTYIIGYGTPHYETNGETTCDYSRGGTSAGTYIVSADSLNVRSGASTSAKIIGGLKKANTVKVLSFEEGFAKIETASGTAYTSRYYLELVAAAPVPEEPEEPETTEEEILPEESEPETAPESTPDAESGNTDTEDSEILQEPEGTDPGDASDEPNTEEAPDGDVYPVTEETGCGASLGTSALFAVILLPSAAIPFLFRRKR